MMDKCARRYKPLDYEVYQLRRSVDSYIQGLVDIDRKSACKRLSRRAESPSDIPSDAHLVYMCADELIDWLLNHKRSRPGFLISKDMQAENYRLMVKEVHNRVQHALSRRETFTELRLIELLPIVRSGHDK